MSADDLTVLSAEETLAVRRSEKCSRWSPPEVSRHDSCSVQLESRIWSLHHDVTPAGRHEAGGLSNEQHERPAAADQRI